MPGPWLKDEAQRYPTVIRSRIDFMFVEEPKGELDVPLAAVSFPENLLYRGSDSCQFTSDSSLKAS
jgi:hypothetical protein